MSWSIGYDTTWNRDIGYGVPAYCDHPDCNAEIDRGLAYVCCGQMAYGGDEGCGLFFCGDHANWNHQCERCAAYDEEAEEGPPTFDAKPDHPTWMRFKLRDASWAQWRRENPTEVAAIRAALRSLAGAPVPASDRSRSTTHAVDSVDVTEPTP